MSGVTVTPGTYQILQSIALPRSCNGQDIEDGCCLCRLHRGSKTARCMVVVRWTIAYWLLCVVGQLAPTIILTKREQISSECVLDYVLDEPVWWHPSRRRLRSSSRPSILSSFRRQRHRQSGMYKGYTLLELLLSLESSWVLTLWRPLLPYGYSYKNILCQTGLIRSDTGCFTAVPMWQQWASKSSRTFLHITIIYYWYPGCASVRRDSWLSKMVVCDL